MVQIQPSFTETTHVSGPNTIPKKPPNSARSGIQILILHDINTVTMFAMPIYFNNYPVARIYYPSQVLPVNTSCKLCRSFKFVLFELKVVFICN